MKRGVLLALRALAALVLVLGVPALYASCQSLANIEDRELGQCGEFCDTVMQNCKNENKVYETREKCMGVCKFLDVGDSNEPQGSDTLACRLREAKLANGAADENISDHCRSAGPEGLDCGGACLSYCTLYERACGQIQCGSHENCVAKCEGLRNKKSFNLVDDYEGNSLQCRLVHLSNASVTRGPHCGHGQLSTPTDHCNDLPEPGSGEAGSGSTAVSGRVDEPLCSDYCRVIGVACQGADAMYESDKQCLALCNYFVQGQIADKTENTRGCRLYHSYNSLCDPTHHCAHAGPGGEGHCGTTTDDKCISYCHLASGVCPAQYGTEFSNDDAQCMAACKGLPDHEFSDDLAKGTRYNVAYAATPGTLACRYLALSRAAQAGLDSPDRCPAAFGENECSE